MPLDTLPALLVVASRDSLKAKWLTWVKVRNPAADGRPGTQVDQDGSVWADAGSLLISKAVILSNGISPSTAAGSLLDSWMTRRGTRRQGAVGAGGAVSVQTSSNGTTLKAGDILTHIPSGQQYQVLTGGIYTNGQAVPVVGLSTGPQTDQPAGTVLTWLSPRQGVTSSNAVVVAQANGSGLDGGTGPETDDAGQARLQLLANNPAASGNDGELQQFLSQLNDIAVEQGFTYPGIMGPGTTGITFTLRPGVPGASRIPTPTQLALALSELAGSFPGDDGIYMCAIVANPVTVVLKVTWAQAAYAWADATTFPLYHPSPNLVSAAANAGGVLSPTAFRVTSTSMSEVPQVGQSIAFFDLANLVFRRKKILTVTVISATACDLTVDLASGVSDGSYTPISGQPCCPWSDSLNSVVTPLVTYFSKLGPGEQVASFFDPGLRQRRSPTSPQVWPNQITNRLLGGAPVPVPAAGPQQNQPPVPTLFSTATLYDVELIEPATLPYATPTGTPGVSSYLNTIGPALVVFPE